MLVFVLFKVTSHAEGLKQVAVSVAELDVASSLALLALERGFVKPVIGNKKEFHVKGGRHPVVDTLQPNNFVCNDCDLGDKNVWIVTGPNMGGKYSLKVSLHSLDDINGYGACRSKNQLDQWRNGQLSTWSWVKSFPRAQLLRSYLTLCSVCKILLYCVWSTPEILF